MIMYSLRGLIPTRFLSLIAHFTIITTLLWESKKSVTNCLPLDHTETMFQSQQNQMLWGLSIKIVLIIFELISFLFGITMFNPTSSALSIFCHSSGTVFLTYFIVYNWQCGWFWWVFAFCSVIPALNDVFVLFDVILHKRY